MARAGQFRARATFQRRDTAAGLDAYGNPAPAAWADLVTLWADLRETPGREAIAAGRVEATSTGTLRLRGSAAARDLGAGDRVRIRGGLWSILSDPAWVDGSGAVLELRLERGGAGR